MPDRRVTLSVIDAGAAMAFINDVVCDANVVLTTICGTCIRMQRSEIEQQEELSATSTLGGIT
jgi:hypothetical protein